MPLCLSPLHCPAWTGRGSTSCPNSPEHRRRGREAGAERPAAAVAPRGSGPRCRPRGELLSRPCYRGLIIRGRVGTGTPACCSGGCPGPAARALTRLADPEQQRGEPLGKRPEKGRRTEGAALNCLPVKPRLTCWKTYF